jgi:5-methylcytosine-specific restriction endonuclease McrA
MFLTKGKKRNIASNGTYKQIIKTLSVEKGMDELNIYLNTFNCKKRKNQKQYDRYRIFKSKGLKCYLCGREANTCLIQININNTPCYNFYHINKNGNLILLTIDHKIPKCNGGKINMENAFPCCIICNEMKALKDSNYSPSGIESYNKAKKILSIVE